MGLTMAEKVLARASERDSVAPGEILTARVDLAMCHEAMAVCGMKLAERGIEKVWDPERVVVILDHYFPAPNVRMAAGHSLVREMVKKFGLRHFLGHAGICHQVLTERGFVRPGELVLGADSHSTTSGALGVELGAKFAMFEGDARCREYLAQRGVAAEPFGPDPDAVCAAERSVDVSDLAPMVALPHSPGNVRRAEEIAPTRVDQAYLRSCTSGA